MNRAELLTAATVAVSDRAASYGRPENLFSRIATRWNLTLTHRMGWIVNLTPADVALLMIDLKVERLIANEGHEDSWVDIAGYAACGAEIVTQAAPVSAEPPRPTMTAEDTVDEGLAEIAARFAPVQRETAL